MALLVAVGVAKNQMFNQMRNAGTIDRRSWHYKGSAVFLGGLFKADNVEAVAQARLVCHG
ncbi:hypothetical protein GCM10011338_13420 [Alteromonas lipolytica]|nr:hypothetical protein GCM10011338_13420 [Alteromonas lipolytica]